ncbi:MAG: class I SAM-dependent methyltransferase [Myxococcota bacterium]
MNDATTRALNELNRRFYAECAEEFAATRDAPWPGWRNLLPLLRGRSHATILDVGCGNARFARFLSTALHAPFLYCGIDASAPLLALAKPALADLPGARLVQADLVLEPLEAPLPADGRFDCVAAFGLLHHVPGESRRRALIRALAERVAPGGFLALTFWDFAHEPRFEGKVVADPPLELASELEPGDVLLRWGAAKSPPRLRYCHHTEPPEEVRLLADLPLYPRLAYASDGRSGRLNRYRVLERR